MALSSSALSTLIQAAWLADPKIRFSSPLTTAQQEIIKAMADGVASAVVSHITSSAVVVGTATAVMPGSGTSPVAGTVT